MERERDEAREREALAAQRIHIQDRIIAFQVRLLELQRARSPFDVLDRARQHVDRARGLWANVRGWF
jgi:hypothetical protein